MNHKNRYERLKNIWNEKQVFKSRLISSFLVVGFAFLLLSYRLLELTVYEYDELFVSSENNQIRIFPIDPSRGIIRDRNGIVLARNNPVWTLVITPELIQNHDEIFSWLEENINLSSDALADLNNQISQVSSFSEIPIKQLNEDETAVFAANRFKLPGLDLRERLQRHYPYGRETAHVIGYLGAISPSDQQRLNLGNYTNGTRVGRYGLEYFFEDQLHGALGRQATIVNSRGRVIETLNRNESLQDLSRDISRSLPSLEGEDLELTLDIELQRLAYEHLENWRGSVVAMNPKTGEILVLASNPTFDANDFATGLSQSQYERLLNDQNRPLFNRSLLGAYPPGSTIKPFLALAALELEHIRENSTYFCEGSYSLPNDDHIYRDWLESGHGSVSLNKSIAQSCDVYYYNLATEMGIESISTFLSQFGFGQNMDFGMGRTQAGILPSPSWKRSYFSASQDQVWFPGETVITGIGQGYFSVTPIQLAFAVATLANKGNIVQPKIILNNNSLTGEDAELLPSSIPLRGENIDIVFDAMNSVTHVPGGSAYSIFSNDLNGIVGKTGTAQVFSIGQEDEYDEENTDENLRDHGLFFGIAPQEDPEIIVVAIIENSGGGARVAAPIVKSIIDAFHAKSSNEGIIFASNE